MSRGLFVTASGTEIGKTLIACALAHQARGRGQSVNVLKPLATGFDAGLADSDTAQLLAAAGQELTDANIAACTPWRFGPAIAPDMAATRAGTVIDFDAVVTHCRNGLAAGADLTVIEGVGGTMVPIGGAKTVRDLIEALHLPAVVVSGSYLGAISHLLTAVESLQVRGINVAGIVVSESAQSPVPLAETAEAIARLAPQIPLMTVPRLSGTRPWERVPDLGQLMK